MALSIVGLNSTQRNYIYNNFYTGNTYFTKYRVTTMCILRIRYLNQGGNSGTIVIRWNNEGVQQTRTINVEPYASNRTVTVACQGIGRDEPTVTKTGQVTIQNQRKCYGATVDPHGTELPLVTAGATISAGWANAIASFLRGTAVSPTSSGTTINANFEFTPHASPYTWKDHPIQASNTNNFFHDTYELSGTSVFPAPTDFNNLPDSCFS